MFITYNVRINPKLGRRILGLKLLWTQTKILSITSFVSFSKHISLPSHIIHYLCFSYSIRPTPSDSLRLWLSRAPPKIFSPYFVSASLVRNPPNDKWETHMAGWWVGGLKEGRSLRDYTLIFNPFRNHSSMLIHPGKGLLSKPSEKREVFPLQKLNFPTEVLCNTEHILRVFKRLNNTWWAGLAKMELKRL